MKPVSWSPRNYLTPVHSRSIGVSLVEITQTLLGSTSFPLQSLPPNVVGTILVPSTRYNGLMENPENCGELIRVDTNGKGILDFRRFFSVFTVTT